MSTARDRSWRLLVLGLGGSALIGCSTRVPIEGRDTSVFFPEVRASWVVEPPDTSLASSYGLTMEAELGFGSGDDSQAIRSGETLELESVTFNGPDVLDLDFDLVVGGIHARPGLHFAGGTRLEGIVGVGFSHLRLRAGNGTLSDAENHTGVGPTIGLRLEQQVEAARLYALVKSHNMFANELSGLSIQVLEVGGTYAVADQAALGFAWRWLEYEGDGSSDSDIDLRLSGPVVFLEFTP